MEHARVPVSVSIHLTSLPNLQVVRMGFDINSANYDGQTSLHLMAKQVGSTVRMEASEAGCEWQCSSVHTD